MLCSVELMMDVEHPKHVFHKTKTLCRLSELRDFVAAYKKLQLYYYYYYYYYYFFFFFFFFLRWIVYFLPPALHTGIKGPLRFEKCKAFDLRPFESVLIGGKT